MYLLDFILANAIKSNTKALCTIISLVPFLIIKSKFESVTCLFTHGLSDKIYFVGGNDGLIFFKNTNKAFKKRIE